ncbi:MAG: hypothetical protein ACT4OE_09495 [Sphingosinicella sp.]
MLTAVLLAASLTPLACRPELERIAADARGQPYDLVQGPYEVVPGDLRVHVVYSEDGVHRIVEHRCENGRVVSRSWTERGNGALDPSSIESILRRAKWLEQPGSQQKQ